MSLVKSLFRSLAHFNNQVVYLLGKYHFLQCRPAGNEFTSLCISEKVFILFSVLKDVFNAYRILG